MNIKEAFSKFYQNRKKKNKKEIFKKIIKKTITEEEIIELIVNKSIFKWYEGKKIIDYILENNIQSNTLDSLATTDLKFAIPYFRHKKFDILGEASLEILLTKVDNATILEHIYTIFLNNPNIKEEDKAKTRVNLLEHAKEQNIEPIFFDIANKNDDYITLLSNESFLLDSTLIPNEVNLDVLIERMILNNQIDNLTSIIYTGKILTFKSKHLGGKTILEYLIDNFENGLNLNELSDEILVYMYDKNITILDFLIKKDKNIVFNLFKIENFEIYSERILTILKANNIFLDKSQYKFIIAFSPEHIVRQQENTFKFHDDNSIYNEANLPPEQKAKIEEFRTLMQKDNKSDEDIIELACNYFIQAFIHGKKNALRDLQFLINVKKRIPNEFALNKSNSKTEFFFFQYAGNSFFRHNRISKEDSTTYSIDIANKLNKTVFGHEFGHLLHFFSDYYDIPENYYELAVLDTTRIEKIKKFLTELNSKVDDFVNSIKKDQNLHLGEEDQLSYNEALSHHQEKYYKKLKDDLNKAGEKEGYPIDYVKTLKANNLSPEEFSNQFKFNSTWQTIYQKIYYRFNDEARLLDIFDALSFGVLSTFGLEIDYKTNIFWINFFPYHGTDYYFKKSHHPFNEIIANYIYIVNSPNSEYLIGVLTDIMGIEFVNMLQNFYENMYIAYNWFGDKKTPPKSKK